MAYIVDMIQDNQNTSSESWSTRLDPENVIKYLDGTPGVRILDTLLLNVYCNKTELVNIVGSKVLFTGKVNTSEERCRLEAQVEESRNAMGFS